MLIGVPRIGLITGAARFAAYNSGVCLRVVLELWTFALLPTTPCTCAYAPPALLLDTLHIPVSSPVTVPVCALWLFRCILWFVVPLSSGCFWTSVLTVVLFSLVVL